MGDILDVSLAVTRGLDRDSAREFRCSRSLNGIHVRVFLLAGENPMPRSRLALYISLCIFFSCSCFPNPNYGKIGVRDP